MGEYKAGELQLKVMLGSISGLMYLDKTGTDVTILNIPKKELVIYKKHDFFKESKNILTRPH